MTEPSHKRSSNVGTSGSNHVSPIVNQDKVTVVLVSGFMAPWYSFYPIQAYLRWKGWNHIEIFKYNSIEGTIEGHGQALCEFLIKLAEQRPEHTFYFYCSSMGNLVLRCAFQRPDFPGAGLRGKHVAVAPPWRGVTWGRLMNNWSLARWISGNGCGKQLRNTAMDGFDYMGHHPATLQTLVIAGASSYNLLIPRPNDGTVLLEETYLRTPHWRVLIPWGIHTFLSFTPVAFWYTHQFFMGNLIDFDQHPGLDALDRVAKPAAQSSSSALLSRP